VSGKCRIVDIFSAAKKPCSATPGKFAGSVDDSLDFHVHQTYVCNMADRFSGNKGDEGMASACFFCLCNIGVHSPN
jgi:hypothetical protein